MKTQAMRFETTKVLKRGVHARKVLIFRPILASVDVADEHSAAIVCKLAAMAGKRGRNERV